MECIDTFHEGSDGFREGFDAFREGNACCEIHVRVDAIDVDGRRSSTLRDHGEGRTDSRCVSSRADEASTRHPLEHGQ